MVRHITLRYSPRGVLFSKRFSRGRSRWVGATLGENNNLLTIKKISRSYIRSTCFLWEIGDVAIIKLFSFSWRKRTWIICALKCCLSVVCKDQSASILLLFVWCTWGRRCDYQRRAQPKDQCASTKGRQCSLSYLAPMMPFCFLFFLMPFCCWGGRNPPQHLLPTTPLSLPNLLEKAWSWQWCSSCCRRLQWREVTGFSSFEVAFGCCFTPCHKGIWSTQCTSILNNQTTRAKSLDPTKAVVFWHPFFSNRLSNLYSFSPILRGDNFQNVLKTSA